MPNVVEILFRSRGQGKVIASANRLTNSVANFAAVALRATAVIGGLAGGAGLALLSRSAISAAKDFEQSMAKVAAITGVVGKQFEDMTDLAKEMGKTTVFTASQAADALTFLGMAGLNATQSMEALPGVLNLAAAGGIDLATAADLATNVMGGLQLEVKDLARVNDVMAATASKANTSIVELAGALRVAGPVATTLGLSIEQTSAFLGSMANLGFKAENAGQAMKQMLARLTVALEDTNSKGAKALRALNVEISDGEGGMRNLTDVMADLQNAGLSAGQAMDIFGRFTFSSALAAASAAEGAKALEEELANAAGTADRMAKIQLSTFDGAVKTLISALEAANIAIGELFTKSAAGIGIMESLTNSLRGLADWVTRNTANIRFLAEGMVLFLKASGPQAWALLVAPFKVFAGILAALHNKAFPDIQSDINNLFSDVKTFLQFIIWGAGQIEKGFIATFGNIEVGWVGLMQTFEKSINAFRKLTGRAFQEIGKALAGVGIEAGNAYIKAGNEMVQKALSIGAKLDQELGAAFLSVEKDLEAVDKRVLANFITLTTMADEAAKAMAEIGDEADETKKAIIGMSNALIGFQNVGLITSITPGPSVGEKPTGGGPGRGPGEGFSLTEQLANINVWKAAMIAAGTDVTVVNARAAAMTAGLWRSAWRDTPSFFTFMFDTAFSAVSDIIGEKGIIIAKTFMEAFQAGVSAFNFSVDLVSNITGQLIDGVQFIINSFSEILSLPEQIMSSLTSVSDSITAFPEAMDRMIEKAPELIDQIISGIPLVIDKFVENIPLIVDQLSESIPLVVDSIVTNLPKVVDALVSAMPLVMDSLVKAIPKLVPALIDAAKKFLFAIIDALPELIPVLVDAAIEFVLAVIDALPLLIPALVDAATQFIVAVIDALPEIITGLVDALPVLITAIIDAIPIIITAFIEALPEIFMAIISAIPDIVLALANGIIQSIALIPRMMWDGITSVFDFPDLLNFEFDFPNWGGQGTIEGLLSDALGIRIDVPFIEFARGGMVPGAPNGRSGTAGDTVPARLTPGEFVVKPSGVNASTLPFLNALNFADGGRVPSFDQSALFGFDIPIVDNIIDFIGDAVPGIKEALPIVFSTDFMNDIITNFGLGFVETMFNHAQLAGAGFNKGGLATPFVNGGITTGPTLALLGEKEQEAVIPLSDPFFTGRGGTTIIFNGPVILDELSLSRFSQAISNEQQDESRFSIQGNV